MAITNKQTKEKNQEMVNALTKTNWKVALMIGTKPEGKPTYSSIKMQITAKHGANVLICDVWRKNRELLAWPVATFLSGEVVGIDIETTAVGKFRHDKIEFSNVTVKGFLGDMLAMGVDGEGGRMPYTR